MVPVRLRRGVNEVEEVRGSKMGAWGGEMGGEMEWGVRWGGGVEEGEGMQG